MNKMMNNIKTFMSKNFVVAVGLLAAVLAGFVNMPAADAGAAINFHATNVYVLDGETRVQGIFSNTGDEGAQIGKVMLDVQVFEKNGRIIWQDSAAFANMGVFVGPGEQREHTLRINNKNCRGIVGSYKWHVNTKTQW